MYRFTLYSLFLQLVYSRTIVSRSLVDTAYNIYTNNQRVRESKVSKENSKDQELLNIENAIPNHADTHETSTIPAPSATMTPHDVGPGAGDLETNNQSIVANATRKSAALQGRAIWKERNAQRAKQDHDGPANKEPG